MIKDSKNFVLYYGYGHQDRLSHYDWIVVEPEAQSAQDLAVLKHNGGQVIAYLSVVEVMSTSSFFPKLIDDDFLVNENGHKMMNAIFGNYLADLRSISWREMVLARIDKLIVKRGYNGLWLDTIGNLESPYLRAYFGTELHDAYRAMLEVIRKTYPEIIILQNNGLETVLDYAIPLIDGVCWENPPMGVRQSTPWVNKITGKLNELRTQNPSFHILILEEEQRLRKQTAQHAKKNGWMYYRAKRDYL